MGVGDRAWMGGRVVEGTGLENRQGFTPLVGSNPTPSATILDYLIVYSGFFIHTSALFPQMTPHFELDAQTRLGY